MYLPRQLRNTRRADTTIAAKFRRRIKTGLSVAAIRASNLVPNRLERDIVLSMAVRLLRCSAQFVKIGGHPCWRVEKALKDMGIDYETVPGAALPWQRDKRSELIDKTGGNLYPAIEFEDGTVYREESKDMVETIRAGRLFEKMAVDAAPVTEAEHPPA
jgi:hypothetical protein